MNGTPSGRNKAAFLNFSGGVDDSLVNFKTERMFEVCF